MSLMNISASTNKRHQPSQEEWVELKPTIWQLYIEEDKSLRHVVKFVSEKQGFLLTKKQLTWKLKEWNFRKNTRAAERKSFVQNRYPSPDEALRATMGIRVTNTKIERWKRNITKEAVGTYSRGRSNIAPGKFNHEPALPPEVSDFRAKDSLPFEEDFQIADALLQSSESSGTTLPFSSYSAYPGAALLSELFSALSIALPAHPRSYTTPVSAPEIEDSADSQYLSSTQYADLTSGNTTDQVIALRQQQHRQPDRRLLNISALQSAPMSPFNSICFFSPFEPGKWASQHTQTPQRFTRLTADQHQILELEKRLSKLQGLLPETHPAMLATVRGLRDANWSMGRCKLAEHWCRRVIAISQRTEAPHSPQNLLDHLELIQAIGRQGRYKEAEELYEQLRPAIKQNESFVSSITAGSLAAESLSAQIRIAQGLGYKENAARYSYQLVQWSISTLGPYNHESLCAMILVSEILIDQGIYEESVRLLCLVLQLQERCKQFSYRWRCIAIRTLAEALRWGKYHKESVTIARQSVKLAEEFLGREQDTTLHNMAELGRCLRSAASIAESETVSRDLLAKRASLFGEDDRHTILAMSDLGTTMMEAKQYEEATIWYEKAFQGALKFPESWSDCLAQPYCHSLGQCYERQGRYTDGIALYEQAVHAIQTLKEPNREWYCCIVYRLGECYVHEGRYIDGIALYEQAVHAVQTLKEPNREWYFCIVYQLAECYVHEGRYIDGIALSEQAVLGIRSLKKLEPGLYFALVYQLAECYLHEGRYPEGICICKQVLQEIKDKKWPKDQGWERLISARLADCYKQQGQYGGAAALYEQNVAKIRGTERWTHERCIYYCSRLGVCYKELSRYSDALALYKRSIQDIRDLIGPYDSEIAQIQEWIDSISAQMSEAESK